MLPEIRTTDEDGALTLPEGFKNTLVEIEYVSDSEFITRKVEADEPTLIPVASTG